MFCLNLGCNDFDDMEPESDEHSPAPHSVAAESRLHTHNLLTLKGAEVNSTRF
jgi:hypothetical protein